MIAPSASVSFPETTLGDSKDLLPFVIIRGSRKFRRDVP